MPQITITHAECQQLLSYVNGRDHGSDAGWYYAPKKDFERRHENLKSMLERALISDAPLARVTVNGGAGK